MIRVKVCGITTQADIDLCVEAGADALGFIFADGPRCLSVKAAAELTQRVPPFVTCVAVFAGNHSTDVETALRLCRIDVLQFSGGEAPEFCGSFGKPTISVIHAGEVTAVGGVAPDGKQIDGMMPDDDALKTARAVAVMVDSRVGNRAGGTGRRADDGIAALLRQRSPLPFILAGGLSPENVAAAVAAVQPWGIDVRSGVERDGEKDRRLVERFVREARSIVSSGPLGSIDLRALGGV